MPAAAAAFLLPHPPIIVPAIGGDELRHCRRTCDACAEVAARVVGCAPARVVLVSPHAPAGRRTGSFYATPRIAGSLARFGAPATRVDLPADAEVSTRLRDTPARFTPVEASLDHGALVPLWWLVEAGWAGPTTVVGLPARGDRDTSARLGEALSAALDPVGGPLVLVASGDMSHRTRPGAPAGFHPRAERFDTFCRDLIARGDLRALQNLDEQWRQDAAEDAIEPLVAVAAASGFEARGARVLSYEHPFGVGYLVAVLNDRGGTGAPA